jgi:hypothetical protein
VLGEQPADGGSRKKEKPADGASRKKKKKKDLAVLAGFDNESGCMLACGWSGFSEC